MCAAVAAFTGRGLSCSPLYPRRKPQQQEQSIAIHRSLTTQSSPQKNAQVHGGLTDLKRVRMASERIVWRSGIGLRGSDPSPPLSAFSASEKGGLPTVWRVRSSPEVYGMLDTVKKLTATATGYRRGAAWAR